MKPYVISHLMSSVDGRILSRHWGLKGPSRLFERTAATIKVDAWLVGRTTMQEFSSKKARRKRRGAFRVAKTDFIGVHDAKTYAVAIDPQGKCNWESNRVDTEHVIEVLTESVSSEYLDHLRANRVSYLFGGRRQLDLSLVLEKLRSLFSIRRLRIDGGGTVNGSFLAAGLIDEFSHIVVPVADGTVGSPAVFDVVGGPKGRVADALRLISVKRLPQSVLWCRYKVLK
jgi:2,5-diamino-6-(ribosylamino)-4(3H)-pyrimidinone 5'-phosphate reductase